MTRNFRISLVRTLCMLCAYHPRRCPRKRKEMLIPDGFLYLFDQSPLAAFTRPRKTKSRGRVLARFSLSLSLSLFLFLCVTFLSFFPFLFSLVEREAITGFSPNFIDVKVFTGPLRSFLRFVSSAFCEKHMTSVCIRHSSKYSYLINGRSACDRTRALVRLSRYA